jgi:predicted TIM-barrel fold metal-dependent hydrolase
MIDAHVHVVDPRLPGVKGLPPVLYDSPARLAEQLRREMAATGIDVLLAMGHLGGEGGDPLGVASTLRIAELVPGLHAIGVADPTRTHDDHMSRVEEQIRGGRVKALKGYLGYLHHGPDGPGYRPYYELAARHGLPFVFHTGDTWSTAAKVKYAHPLLVDEVAVDHRGVRFVMAHFGNPWFQDAAEVVYKNENVWADLSGILVGSDADFAEAQGRGTMDRIGQRLRDALEYAERTDRFVYGSDWPLASLPTYAAFLRRVLPAELHPPALDANARALFGL